MEQKSVSGMTKLSGTQLHYIWRCYSLSHDPTLRDRLIAHIMPVLMAEVRKVRKWTPGSMEEQDLVSYAIIGVMEALEHYNPDQNPNLEGYMMCWIQGCVRRGILSFLGLEKKSVPVHIVSIDDSQKDLIDRIPDPEDTYALAEEKIIRQKRSMELKEALAVLTPLQRRIILRHYYQGLPLREISRRLHFSHSWVCHQHQMALRKLREYVLSHPQFLEDPLFSQRNFAENTKYMVSGS